MIYVQIHSCLVVLSFPHQDSRSGCAGIHGSVKSFRNKASGVIPARTSLLAKVFLAGHSGRSLLALSLHYTCCFLIPENPKPCSLNPKPGDLTLRVLQQKHIPGTSVGYILNKFRIHYRPSHNPAKTTTPSIPTRTQAMHVIQDFMRGSIDDEGAGRVVGAYFVRCYLF